MVTYIDGIPSRKDYRKYKVKTVVGADDYHTMQEVLQRRYERVLKENLRKPDLIIVDGGKTQVGAALIILKKLKITDIDLIGLEKDDNHKTTAIITNQMQLVPLDKHSNLYLLLEAMQDEVHRFAVTYFKQTHTKNMYASVLDSVKGLGLRRKKCLFDNFKSLDEIKNASVERLHALGIPQDICKNIIDVLNNDSTK
jgi:excinuclease ABC subunit C